MRERRLQFVSAKTSLPVWSLLGCCLGLLGLAGCLSPQQKVAKEMPALRSRWQADMAQQSAMPDRRVSWTEALALLEQNNLKLRSARMDVTNSQEVARQVYRDLIP